MYWERKEAQMGGGAAGGADGGVKGEVCGNAGVFEA